MAAECKEFDSRAAALGLAWRLAAAAAALIGLVAFLKWVTH